MKILLHLVSSSIAVLIAAYLLPGVTLDNWATAITVAIVLGSINALVKPILVLLTLPITFLTLGLFLLVINAVIILFTDWLVPGFDVSTIWTALLFSLVVAIVSWVINRLLK